MVVKIWTSRPLSLAIVEVLEKKGAMSDAELFDALKDMQEDLGFGMLNQTLMRLEVEGKVYVSWLTKSKRRVELVKRKEK
jgi:hypothetical protein